MSVSLSLGDPDPYGVGASIGNRVGLAFDQLRSAAKAHPVEEEASRAWMHAFYGQRFWEGRGIAQAVHTASLQTLTARRDAGESTHPFSWAAFVAAGR